MGFRNLPVLEGYSLTTRDIMLFSAKTRRTPAQEDVNISKDITFSPDSLALISVPFPHIVIPNCFTPDYYAELCEAYARVQLRGFSETSDYRVDQFHRFDINYDGYTYSPEPSIDAANALRVFFSAEWNRLFSRLFNQMLNLETKLVFHYHPAGNRSGHVHHDHIARAPAEATLLSNGVTAFSPSSSISSSYLGPDYQPKPDESLQAISIIYYLHNDSWIPGDGGETGIYGHDGRTLVKKIAPLNNTLLAFKTSPHSFHRFLSNEKKRSSFVQFFHTFQKIA